MSQEFGDRQRFSDRRELAAVGPGRTAICLSGRVAKLTPTALGGGRPSRRDPGQEPGIQRYHQRRASTDFMK